MLAAVRGREAAGCRVEAVPQCLAGRQASAIATECGKAEMKLTEGRHCTAPRDADGPLAQGPDFLRIGPSPERTLLWVSSSSARTEAPPHLIVGARYP